MPQKTVKSQVQSLARGLRLLEAVIEAGGQVSNAELDDVLPIERSSSFRLLQTLVANGYLTQDERTKRFAAGPKVLELANRATNSTQLSQVCHPYLEELTSLTGETAHCAVLSGPWVLFLDNVMSTHMLGVTDRSRKMEPLHCTALGKALVMDMSDRRLEALLSEDGLKQHTPKTITSFAAFSEELRRVRREGLATDDEEYVTGVRCVAAPVRDFTRQCVGAIGVSAPSTRLNGQALLDARRHVKAIAERLSRHLGYVPE